MLLELNINNIALIESLRIEFAQGFNVLTGETGSGKSIIVDCMNMVLGSRADRSFLRTGAEKGFVQALFAVEGLSSVATALEENGIPNDDGTLLISRELSRSGRNLCRINGMLVPLNTLTQITNLLLDIHGQHEHQSLMRPAMHMTFLDAYGDGEHQALREDVARLARERSHKASALKTLIDSLRERERLADTLRHQVSEINAAKLKPGEEERLQSKLEILSNAEKIRAGVEAAYRLTYQGSGKAISAQEALNTAAIEMDRLAGYSQRYADLATRLHELFYGVQDIGYELQDALDKLPSDPEMEEKVSARLKLIDKLERKYGSDVEAVIAFGRDAEAQLESIETGDMQVAAMQEELKALDVQLVAACGQLTKNRQALAKMLESRVMRELNDLGMANTRFEAQLKPLTKPTASGMETVEFMISPNPGEPMRPLADIASGGELSRIMLAMKAVSADRDQVPSMVFDEIDTGVSGRMAQVVGEKMCMIAIQHQVLCVTHLPQIAALGNTQFRVEKNVIDGRTETQVKRLTHEERVKEISRLVGGAQDTQSSLNHAEEMLRAADLVREQLDKTSGAPS